MKKIFFLLFISLFLSNNVFAEMTIDNSEKIGHLSGRIDLIDKTLDLDDVFTKIDFYHPSLRSAELNRDLAKAEITGARSVFVPKFLSRTLYENYLDLANKRKEVGIASGEIFWQTPFALEVIAFGRTTTQPLLRDDGLTYVNSKAFLDSITKYKLEGFTDDEVSIALRMPLLRDLLIDEPRAQLKKAKLEIPLAELTIRQKRAELFLKAADKYWDWVKAGFQYRVVERLLNLAEERAEAVKQRVDFGAIAPIDYTEASAQIKSRQENLVKAERNLEKESIGLSIYLWKNEFDFVTPTKDSLPLEMPEPISLPEKISEEHLMNSLLQRPEIKVLDFENKQEKINLRLAKNEILPRVDLEVLPTQDLNRFDDRTNFRASVNLEIPFAPLKGRSMLGKSQAKIEKINLSQTLIKGQIQNEVRDAISFINTSRERVILARESMEKYQELAEGERIRFNLGNSNLFLVNAREVSAADAEMKLVDALADHQKSLAQYRYAIGEWSIPDFDEGWFQASNQQTNQI